MRTLAVGDRVYKWRGYRWPGVVVSAYPTLAGEARIVVECTASDCLGAQHIYAPGQVVRLYTAEEAVDAIAVERGRQVAVEGWTVEHDDSRNSGGQLLRAAAAYYFNAISPTPRGRDSVPDGWPWEWKWWKPTHPERDLVISGALALAERDRLMRAGDLIGVAKAHGAYVVAVRALVHGRPQ